MERRDGQLISRLYKCGRLSNQELAVRLGISPSTVTSTAGRLLNEGLITMLDARRFDREIGSGQRRKKTYQLDPDYGYALVVEIDFDCLVIHECRFDLEHISSTRVPITRNHRDVILDRAEAELRSFMAAHPGRLLGIGFSMPGQVDYDRGVAIHNTRIDDWENVSFDRFTSFSRNLVTENVANAVALGEHFRGSAQDVDDFLVLHVGNGAGMGIMIDGQLHRGHNFAAGEAGHVIVEESSGTTCNCGNRGCLESFVSRRAVLRELEKLRESDVPSGILSNPHLENGDEVYRLLGKYYEGGDKVAYLVVEELAHKLGLAAANFAQVLAPARIVLSGPISTLGNRFLELVQQTLRRYHLPWLDPVPIVYGRNDSIVAAQGVALLVFRKLWER
jgi:glucokinase